jgi:gamma-glutamyltranspeptidase/glutathione hydrolase
MHTRRLTASIVALAVATLTISLSAGNTPYRARQGMVVSQSDIASEVGWKVMREGGNAIDGAVATALALAVTHPTAGNIGGGGFLVYRGGDGTTTTFDFREMAPAGANPTMWMKDGKYDFDIHHNSTARWGAGTVAGLYLAHQKLGSKPWKDLVLPAVALARDGFEIRRARGVARAHDPGVQEVPGVARAVLEERRGLPGRRDPEAARSGEVAAADRGQRSGRLLRG